MSNIHNDLRVNGRVTIPRRELEVAASRSSGPGGQHVNTSSTRIEVRWNALASSALTVADKERLAEKLATRIDGECVIRVTASESRSQRRNRNVAEARLAELVRRALVVPRARRATSRPRGANEARLQSKHKRAEHKQARHWRNDD